MFSTLGHMGSRNLCEETFCETAPLLSGHSLSVPACSWAQELFEWYQESFFVQKRFLLRESFLIIPLMIGWIRHYTKQHTTVSSHEVWLTDILHVFVAAGWCSKWSMKHTTLIDTTAHPVHGPSSNCKIWSWRLVSRALKLLQPPLHPTAVGQNRLGGWEDRGGGGLAGSVSAVCGRIFGKQAKVLKKMNK